MLGDAAHNSGDALILGSSLFVMASTLRVKARLALIKSFVMLGFGLVTFFHVFLIFWAILLIFVIYKIQFKDIFTQLKYIIPIWLVGFFWSVESAIYVTSVIGTYFLGFIFLGKHKINSKIYVLLSFPASILICLILICLFYLININNLPDFYSFVEFVFGWFSKIIIL